MACTCTTPTTIPFHHLPCIKTLTLQLWEQGKYLGLETSRFLNAQDLLIISPASSYLELKTYFKQGTKHLRQKHHEYHQGWYVG
jgi:hypothetical protein